MLILRMAGVNMRDMNAVHRNCVLSVASRIAQEQPVTKSQALDFFYALHEYFSQQQIASSEVDARETFQLAAKAARSVVDELGMPPGYVHKYEPGVDDATRAENVRADYEQARRLVGSQFTLDSMWE
jgi:hypothetical protein